MVKLQFETLRLEYFSFFLHWMTFSERTASRYFCACTVYNKKKHGTQCQFTEKTIFQGLVFGKFPFVSMVTEVGKFWHGFAKQNMEILMLLVVHNVKYSFRKIFIGIEK